MLNNNVQKENDELLKFILEKRFFDIWRKERRNSTLETENRKKLINESKVEIYLTSSCNQNCEYCYLVKNKNKIYPQEFDKKEYVLKNLKILLNWFIEENFYIPVIELYSGEIWHTSYGIEVLDIVEKAVQNGLNVDQIVIPTNGSFLRNSNQRELIQKYINRFKNTYLIPLTFSFSVDGKIIEEMSRPVINKNDLKDDEFFEQMFLFAAHNKFYFHPMVSANNIKYWIENYKWWKEKIDFYEMPFDSLMMLEVRSNEWTEKAINDYNKFLDYLLEDFLKNNTVQDLANVLVGNVMFNYEEINGYIPFLINEAELHATCSIANHLTIRVGDLAICPCHRTAYNKYLYGHFIVENDKIVGVKANNTQMAIRILFANNNLCSFRCDNCPFAFCCLKGCFGNQLELNKDPFLPVLSMCNFFEKKYTHLLEKYEELGVFSQYIEKITPYEVEYLKAQQLLNFRKDVYKWLGRK